MQTKSDQIRKALDAGDTRKAVSLASKFHDRSEDTQLYKRAQGAINNPAFYKQMGKDPDAIFEEAVANLKERFN